MNFKNIIIDFVLHFIMVLVAAIIVSFLYSLIVHGAGVIDWETSFRLAIIFGVVFSWINARERKRKEK